jgi:ABC-type transporter Mla maintaining outer membrane lipid asymmetry ATPase subunit MlaF
MASSTAESLVELRNLTFGYGDRVIPDDISLSVPRGKVTALMGASGGGTTTILQLIGEQSRARSGGPVLLHYPGYSINEDFGLGAVAVQRPRQKGAAP